MIAMAKPRMSRRNFKFLAVTAIAILMSFSPFKALGQLAPVAFLVGVIIVVRIRPGRHIVKLGTWLFFYVFAGLIYYILVPEFSFLSYFLFLLTISSFLILLLDFKPILNHSLITKISSFLVALALFEAIYGASQAVVGVSRSGTFDYGTGDIVRGTVEPSFTPLGLGGNQIFAIQMSTILIFIIATTPPRMSRGRILALSAILVSWLLASVLHTVLYFSVAAIIAAFLSLRLDLRRLTIRLAKTHVAVLACGVFLLALVPVVLPSNLATLPQFIRGNLSIGPYSPSHKARAIFNTLFLLPEEFPGQPIVGMGPGQYSSRASLIRTGEYLKGTTVPLPRYVAKATERNILSLYRDFHVQHPHGASSFLPFFSWLTLYGEMGALGMLMVAGIIIAMIRQLASRTSKDFPRMNYACIALLLYIALLGLHDNYWEFTQAIFPGVLLLKLCYDYLDRYKVKSA